MSSCVQHWPTLPPGQVDPTNPPRSEQDGRTALLQGFTPGRPLSIWTDTRISQWRTAFDAIPAPFPDAAILRRLHSDPYTARCLALLITASRTPVPYWVYRLASLKGLVWIWPTLPSALRRALRTSMNICGGVRTFPELLLLDGHTHEPNQTETLFRPFRRSHCPSPTHLATALRAQLTKKHNPNTSYAIRLIEPQLTIEDYLRATAKVPTDFYNHPALPLSRQRHVLRQFATTNPGPKAIPTTLYGLPLLTPFSLRPADHPRSWALTTHWIPIWDAFSRIDLLTSPQLQLPDPEEVSRSLAQALLTQEWPLIKLERIAHWIGANTFLTQTQQKPSPQTAPGFTPLTLSELLEAP